MKSFLKVVLGAGFVFLMAGEALSNTRCRECIPVHTVWSTPIEPWGLELPSDLMRDYNVVPRGGEPGNAVVERPNPTPQERKRNAEAVNKKARSMGIAALEQIKKFLGRISGSAKGVNEKTTITVSPDGTRTEIRHKSEWCVEVGAEKKCHDTANFRSESAWGLWKDIDRTYTVRVAFALAKGREASDREVEEMLGVKGDLELRTRHGKSVLCPVVEGTDVVRVYDHFGGPNFRCPDGYRMIGGGSPLHGETGFEMTCQEKDKVGECEYNDDHLVGLYEYALRM